MHYQFALIRSTFTIKNKNRLAIFAIAFFFIGAGGLAPLILVILKLEASIFMLSIAVFLFMYYIFSSRIIDGYKTIGTVLFDDNGITISEPNQNIEYNNIAKFYIILSTGSERSTNENSRTYLVQVAKKDTSIITIHVTREQFANNKSNKVCIWNNNNELLNALKETGIKYSFEKNKYFGDYR